MVRVGKNFSTALLDFQKDDSLRIVCPSQTKYCAMPMRAALLLATAWTIALSCSATTHNPSSRVAEGPALSKVKIEGKAQTGVNEYLTSAKSNKYSGEETEARRVVSDGEFAYMRQSQVGTEFHLPTVPEVYGSDKTDFGEPNNSPTAVSDRFRWDPDFGFNVYRLTFDFGPFSLWTWPAPQPIHNRESAWPCNRHGAARCPVCHGHCEVDDDCEGQLKCYQRQQGINTIKSAVAPECEALNGWGPSTPQGGMVNVGRFSSYSYNYCYHPAATSRYVYGTLQYRTLLSSTSIDMSSKTYLSLWMRCKETAWLPNVVVKLNGGLGTGMGQRELLLTCD